MGQGLKLHAVSLAILSWRGDCLLLQWTAVQEGGPPTRTNLELGVRCYVVPLQLLASCRDTVRVHQACHTAKRLL